MIDKKPRIIDTTVEIEKVPSDKDANTKPQEQYKYSVKLGSSSEPAPEQKPAPQPIIKAELQEKLEKRFDVAKYAQALSSKASVANVSKKAQGVAKGFLVAVDGFAKFVTREEDPKRNEVIQKARSPILFAMWVGIIVFVVGGLWAGFAPLDAASHAQGIVVASSKKQIIQHREGGILESLNVKEGEVVEAGQVLAVIEDKNSRSQLEGYRLQKSSLEKQLELYKEQVAALEDLYKKGFTQRAVLLDAQSREANTIHTLSGVSAALESLEAQVQRLSVKAPVSGIVNQIQFHTIGGTVHQGATLMTVTPKDDNLIVETYVSPADIDLVRVGLKAKVQIGAFKHRSVGYLTGVVTFVSPDVIELAQNQGYTQEGMILQRMGPQFKVRVEVNKEELKTISKYREYHLYPGMTADVSIVTGERTLLQYLLDPLTATFMHAFKEQ